uniref:(northern house mosquito) hypothetical protein n=1 Tax=Culex pipiens TaxID=7175 RepID=A0A8D8L4D3_CULPI
MNLGTRRRCWPRLRPPANRSQSSSFCVFTYEGEECSRSLFQRHLPEVHLVLYCHTLSVTWLLTTNKLTAIDFSLFKTKKLLFLFFLRIFLFKNQIFLPVVSRQILAAAGEFCSESRSSLFFVTCRTES